MAPQPPSPSSSSQVNVFATPTQSTLVFDAGEPSIVTQTVFVGPTGQPTSDASSATPLPIGAIVGGTVAGIVIVVLAVGGWIYWGRQLKKQEELRKAQAAMQKPTRIPLKHARGSDHSSFWGKEAKSGLSVEIIGPTDSLPRLPKHAPRKPEGIIVTPPSRQSSSSSSSSKPKSPIRESRRPQPSVATSRSGSSNLSHSSFRPSPLSRGESFIPPRTPPPDGGASSPEPPRQPRSPPPRITIPRSPLSLHPPQPSPRSPLRSLHTAATVPGLSLAIPPSIDARPNRLSAQSVQPNSPSTLHNFDAPVGLAWSGDDPEEETVWRGSRVL